jgi:hypothetical protein
MTNWKDETCRKCIFRVYASCINTPCDTYVIVFDRKKKKKKYSKACAEFKLKEGGND